MYRIACPVHPNVVQSMRKAIKIRVAVAARARSISTAKPPSQHRLAVTNETFEFDDGHLKLDGVLGEKTCSTLQSWVNVNQPDSKMPLACDGALGSKTVTGIQQTLDQLGYEVKVDGTLGPKTVETLQHHTNRYGWIYASKHVHMSHRRSMRPFDLFLLKLLKRHVFFKLSQLFSNMISFSFSLSLS